MRSAVTFKENGDELFVLFRMHDSRKVERVDDAREQPIGATASHSISPANTSMKDGFHSGNIDPVRNLIAKIPSIVFDAVQVGTGSEKQLVTDNRR